MKLNNAIARLRRAGDENSRTTQKLFEAAKELARLIESNVPEDAILPRGYVVRERRSNQGGASFLESPYCDEGGYAPLVDGYNGYLHGDFHAPMQMPSRETIMRFAADVADGWVDEVAVWLEKRAEDSITATDTLQSAVEKLSA